jgi:hypothetical protein
MDFSCSEVLKLEDMEDLLDEADSYQVIIDALSEAISKSFGNGVGQGKN